MEMPLFKSLFNILPGLLQMILLSLLRQKQSHLYRRYWDNMDGPITMEMVVKIYSSRELVHFMVLMRGMFSCEIVLLRTFEHFLLPLVDSLVSSVKVFGSLRLPAALVKEMIFSLLPFMILVFRVLV